MVDERFLPRCMSCFMTYPSPSTCYLCGPRSEAPREMPRLMGVDPFAPSPGELAHQDSDYPDVRQRYLEFSDPSDPMEWTSEVRADFRPDDYGADEEGNERRRERLPSDDPDTTQPPYGEPLPERWAEAGPSPVKSGGADEIDDGERRPFEVTERDVRLPERQPAPDEREPADTGHEDQPRDGDDSAATCLMCRAGVPSDGVLCTRCAGSTEDPRALRAERATGIDIEGRDRKPRCCVCVDQPAGIKGVCQQCGLQAEAEERRMERDRHGRPENPPDLRPDHFGSDLAGVMLRYQGLAGEIRPYRTLKVETGLFNHDVREWTGLSTKDKEYVGLRLDAHHIVEAVWFDKFKDEFERCFGWRSTLDMDTIALPTESHIRSGDRMAEDLGLLGAEGRSSLTVQLQRWLEDSDSRSPIRTLGHLFDATEAFYFRPIRSSDPARQIELPREDRTYERLREWFADKRRRIAEASADA